MTTQGHLMTFLGVDLEITDSPAGRRPEPRALRAFDVFDFQGRDGRTYSVLCISSEAGPEIDKASFRYLSNLRVNGMSYRRVRAAFVALGLLYEFYKCVWEGQTLTPDRLPTLVGEYLEARRHGLRHAVGEQTLIWFPVKIDTVLRDRQFISEYAEFVLDDTRPSFFKRFSPGDFGLPSYRKALKQVARISIASRSSNLLHHLSRNWKPKPASPFGLEERRASLGRGQGKRFLRFDAIRRLIDGTTSLMQKMLFIEAYFGGPRLCEMLNHWRCDLLDGRLRPKLFLDDIPMNTPLLLSAHPSQSRYTGSLYDFGLDRLQVLHRDYGLRPRSDQAGRPIAAGWKGIIFDRDDLRLSQIFWMNADYGILFGECVAIAKREIYPAIASDVFLAHPYLYVNDDKRRKQFGHPLKYSNARKAHARAVERLGLDAKLLGKGIHNARHAYRGQMKKLGLSKEDQQRFMHHASIDSQDEYAKCVVDLNMRLKSIYRGLPNE